LIGEIHGFVNKWLWQLTRQVVSVTVLLGIGVLLASWLGSWWPESPNWPVLCGALTWVAFLLVSLPLLTGAVGKVRAIAIIYAEGTIPAEEEAERAFAQRRRRARRLFAIGLVLLTAWIAALCWLLEPPWEALPALPLLFAAAAWDNGRSFRKYYARIAAIAVPLRARVVPPAAMLLDAHAERRRGSRTSDPFA
jgi:hypothetical protein